MLFPVRPRTRVRFPPPPSQSLVWLRAVVVTRFQFCPKLGEVMSHRLRPLIGLGTALIAAVAGEPAASAGLAAETPVVVSSADEIHATAGWNQRKTVEYVAFTRKDPRTGRQQALVRKIRRDGSRTTLRLNWSGDADVGGFFFGPRVLYAQAPGDGDLDLRVFNLATGVRWTPRGVNTNKNEWLPTRSRRHLLFNRDDGEDGTVTRVVLRDVRASGDAETVLARTTAADDFAYAGQVRGNWAVWTMCNPVCDVYKRDIAARLTTQIPRPISDPVRSQYDASVKADGTVYLVRSGGEPCASTIEIVRYGVNDSPEGTAIAQIQPSRFTTLTYARSNPDGSTDIFFSRGSCSSFKSDIYKVTDPASP
jgi:hypothetical protein